MWDEVVNDAIAKLESAEMAIEAAMKCMETVEAAFQRRDKGCNDKLNHCMSSCEISIDCNQLIADALGQLKEVRDLFAGALEWTVSWVIPKSWEDWLHENLQGGSFEDSVEDFTANFLGFSCMNFPKGCKCCCKEKLKRAGF